MRDYLKQHLGDLLALFALAATVGIFFFRLFWPETSIIVTPDFGRSDAWHFSLPTKLALAQSLKRGELPFWEPRMGMGFPLFAEGQVGALFLPNLLLFTFIDDPVVAYNATYVVLFLILGWGMYCWLRVIGCTRLASLFGAVTIVFSGQTIPRLPHHTLLESLSLTPFLLTLGHMVITKKAGFWVSIFAFALSQQLFTGSPQPVLLTLLMIGIYSSIIATTHHRQQSPYPLFLSSPRTRGSSDKKMLDSRFRGNDNQQVSFLPIIRLTIAILLGVSLTAVQLLPSAELLRESTSPSGFSPEEASYYSFPLVHLKTLVAPFALGNPKLGTYPPFTAFDGSIFWENNLFIGILPIALLVLGFIRPPLARQGEALRKFFAAALVASFLLMLGKHSPLYLLYSVWPLNLFRVPSRFAWIFLITIVTAASWFLSQILVTQRRWGKTITIVAALLITANTYQLITAWWNYHAIQPARSWLTASPFIEALKKSPVPVRTIGSELIHNQQFLKEGWGRNLDWYQFLTNVPAPNGNLYWDLRQTDVYAGRFLKRPSLVESLLGNEIKASQSVATVSAQGKRLLDVYHAATIVSAVPLDMDEPLAQATATSSAGITITAYRNPAALPRAYLATQTTVASTFTKAAETIASPTFIPGSMVVVHDEKHALDSSTQEKGTVTITDEKPLKVTMRADVTADQAILVFADTYYPGWQVSVDGQQTEIFPVNIKERAVRVSRGSHEIIWKYKPKSVYVGFWISVAGTLITLGFLFLDRKLIKRSARTSEITNY